MQTWRLRVDGHDHRVEADTGLSHEVRWYVDDVLVGETKSMDDTLLLSSDAGDLEVRYSGLGAPRRATLTGTDLVPDPGSRADRHERRFREHPRLYVAVATVAGVLKVVVPILLAVLAARFAFRSTCPCPTCPTSRRSRRRTCRRCRRRRSRGRTGSSRAGSGPCSTR